MRRCGDRFYIWSGDLIWIPLLYRAPFHPRIPSKSEKVLYFQRLQSLEMKNIPSFIPASPQRKT